MKKILFLISLMFTFTFASNIELNDQEKKELLEWVNTYCNENHQSYASLSKDRYFYCEMKAPKCSNGSRCYDKLNGSVVLGSNISPWRGEVMEYLFIVGVTLVFGLIFYAVFLSLEEYTLSKNYHNRYQIVKYRKNRAIAGVIALHLFAIGYMCFSIIKNYTFDAMRNGTLNEFKIALPIFDQVNNGESALMLAVSSGYLENVKYLIEEKKYDPNKPGKIDNFSKPKTPFDLALDNRAYDIADYLKHYLKDSQPVSVITAAKSFDMDLLQKSIEKTNPDFNTTLDAFVTAIHFQDYDAIKYLYNLEPTMINKKSRVFFDDTPLEHAIEINDLDIVKFLVSKGVDVNECSLITVLAQNNKIEMFQYLLDNGMQVHRECGNTIYKAIKRYKSNQLKSLVLQKKWITEYEFNQILY